MHTAKELKFMRKAIDAARRSKAEDNRPHPFVGVVVVKNGKEIDVSYRGERGAGDHAEFTALEKKLKDESLVGATVYTTLEPCTKRGRHKTPCAERLIDRKVGRVVIGMLDPDPNICGKGFRKLVEAKVVVDAFPNDLMLEIEELNRNFTREKKKQQDLPLLDPASPAANIQRPLDEWYATLNRIYWNRNFAYDASKIFAHLVEVIGGLSSVASNKRKFGVDPQRHLVKSFAWWMALCGKVGVKSVEAMLWDKFPGVCTYCHKRPHDQDICAERKASVAGPQWHLLSRFGRRNKRPKRLRDWQQLFAGIYPAKLTDEFGPAFAHLAEELGELSEAVRVFHAQPGYFLSEAADVFAWLMRIQNILEAQNETKAVEFGNALEREFFRMYPDGCKECARMRCVCPPILSSTIGRIAHEVPFQRSASSGGARFMTPERASTFFSQVEVAPRNRRKV